MSSSNEFQTVGPATETWNEDLMAAGRTQALAENSVRNWCAVVRQIPRSLVMLALVHEHTELILDSFWNILGK